MKVAVVIPNWNERELLAACLDSLRAQSVPLDVIVVDNGSDDGSADMVEADYKWVHLLRKKRNYGFAGGVNFGIKYALEHGAEYVALFNNDAVADKDWLKYLLMAAEAHPEAGLVTCKFMRLDKVHLDSTGDFMTTWGMPMPRGRNEKDNGQYDELHEVFGATGGATLYRASMFNEVGLFDEDFFAYYEDVDLSFRAQLAGWRAYYEPRSVAYHHVSATSSKMGDFARYHSVKNFILLYAKNMPGRLYWQYGFFFMIVYARWALGSLMRGKALPFMKGTWAALRLHRSTKAKRHKIQANRKVSVAYINSILHHGRPRRAPTIASE